MKKIFILVIIIAVSYAIYRISQPTCKACKGEKMHIKSSCPPVASAYTTVYRYLNCFCDKYQDWKEISNIILRISYYRDLYSKIYPYNVFGTKKISCFDDELQTDVFEDTEVFLYIEQDTSKVIYDGAFRKISINNIRTDYIGILDIGKENRTIIRNEKGTTIKYRLNYDELNSHALIKFQQAIHHDSTYQKQFKNVEYKLVNKVTNRQDASIRYEDFGERFYLDVF